MTETTDSSPEGQPNPDPAEPDVATSPPATAESGTGDAQDEPTDKKRAALRETVILAAIALVLYYVMLTFVARPYLIPSESMEQTLHGCPGCYGDRVLVDKLVYNFTEPEPGEVIVFERPSTWNQSEFQSNRSSNGFVSWLQDIGAAFGLAAPDEDDVVKRIVAVAGQRVECCDDQNRVVVDGQLLLSDGALVAPRTKKAGA